MTRIKRIGIKKGPREKSALIFLIAQGKGCKIHCLELLTMVAPMVPFSFQYYNIFQGYSKAVSMGGAARKKVTKIHTSV